MLWPVRDHRIAKSEFFRFPDGQPLWCSYDRPWPSPSAFSTTHWPPSYVGTLSTTLLISKSASAPGWCCRGTIDSEEAVGFQTVWLRRKLELGCRRWCERCMWEDGGFVGVVFGVSRSRHVSWGRERKCAWMQIAQIQLCKAMSKIHIYAEDVPNFESPSAQISRISGSTSRSHVQLR